MQRLIVFLVLFCWRCTILFPPSSSVLEHIPCARTSSQGPTDLIPSSSEDDIAPIIAKSRGTNYSLDLHIPPHRLLLLTYETRPTKTPNFGPAGPSVLNIGHKKKWSTMADKARGPYEWLRDERGAHSERRPSSWRNVSENDLVVFTDSDVVWHSCTEQDFVERYLAYGKTIVVGAEANLHSLSCEDCPSSSGAFWPNGTDPEVCKSEGVNVKTLLGIVAAAPPAPPGAPGAPGRAGRAAGLGAGGGAGSLGQRGQRRGRPGDGDTDDEDRGRWRLPASFFTEAAMRQFSTWMPAEEYSEAVGMRFLNAGFIIGPVWALREFYAKVVSFMDEGRVCGTGDQNAVWQAFLAYYREEDEELHRGIAAGKNSSRKISVALDFRSELVLNAWGLKLSTTVVRAERFRRLCFIHANGLFGGFKRKFLAAFEKVASAVQGRAWNGREWNHGRTGIIVNSSSVADSRFEAGRREETAEKKFSTKEQSTLGSGERRERVSTRTSSPEEDEDDGRDESSQQSPVPVHQTEINNPRQKNLHICLRGCNPMMAALPGNHFHSIVGQGLNAFEAIQRAVRQHTRNGTGDVIKVRTVTTTCNIGGAWRKFLQFLLQVPTRGVDAGGNEWNFKTPSSGGDEPPPSLVCPWPKTTTGEQRSVEQPPDLPESTRTKEEQFPMVASSATTKSTSTVLDVVVAEDADYPVIPLHLPVGGSRGSTKGRVDPGDPGCWAFPWIHRGWQALRAQARFVLQKKTSGEGQDQFLSKPPHVVLNLRTKPQTRRQTKNDLEVRKKLKILVEESGGKFTFVDTAMVDFRKQASVYLDADILIFMHGASASNLSFLPPGALVVEIFPGVSWHCYFSYMQPRESKRWNYVVMSGSGSGRGFAANKAASSPPEQQQQQQPPVPLWRNASLTPFPGSCRSRTEEELCDQNSQCATYELGSSGVFAKNKNQVDGNDDVKEGYEKLVHGQRVDAWTRSRDLPSQFINTQRLGELVRAAVRAAVRAGVLGTTSSEAGGTISVDTSTTSTGGADGTVGEEDVGGGPKNFETTRASLFRTVLERLGQDEEWFRPGACRGHAWQLLEEST